jgi:flagellar hook-associated protein 2
MSDISSTSSTSSTSPSLLVNGLISGIDTTSVIQALLSSYQTPITNLQDQQTSLKGQVSDYQTLNSDLQAIQTAAQALNTNSQWNLATATSSDTSVATATSSAGAQTGTLGFTVAQLAQGNVLLSSGGVSSEAATVTGASSLLAATGGAGIGFSNLSASSGLALGSHTITVQQSSAAAELTGTPGASTTTQEGVNDTLALSVGGQSYTLTLQPGQNLTPTQLVSEINAAATTADAPVTASLSSTGSLVLQTNAQGSDATIEATAGSTAAASLGLTTGQEAVGTDAIVSVDGTTTDLSSISAGGTVTLSAPAGSITATVGDTPSASGSLISSGTADAALVSTGNGSLSALVQNLNGAGLGLSATAVQEASGDYRLQVAASQTGLSGAVSLDSSGLSSGSLGAISTITDAQDAEVTVGGASGYTLQSSTDTFNSLMPGTAVTVAALGSATVTVSPNATGEATAVQTLVGAANQALSDISSLAGYNESTKTAGPLMGSAVVESIQQSILAAVASAAGSSGLGSPSAVGITLTSEGTINFDQSTFETAYANNPTGVASLFSTGGTYAPSGSATAGQVSLLYAGTSTPAGSYALQITQSATQASETGATLSGGVVTAPETLSISSGGASTSYTTAAGESLESIATGLNNAFSANSLSLSAVVSNNQLSIESIGYGSAASFSVSSSAPGAGTTGLGGATAGEAATYAGTDVAGTINGAAATGTGQVLAAPASGDLAGLSFLVTTPGVTSATSIGSYTYTPGLAQQLASIGDSASNASSGSLTNEINGLTNESTGLNGQITNYQSLEQSEDTLLTNRFAQMETTLGTLKNESSELSSQISDLTGF